MKAIMLSIQPKWCELITSGKKTVEVRKTRPKIETPFKVYIYCTKQKVNGEILLTYDKKVEGRNRGFRDNGDILLAGKVIGEFVCDYIGTVDWTSNPNKKDWKDWFNEETCLTDRETYEYTKGDKFYEWHISDLVIYDKPKELEEFRKLCKYRNTDGSCQYRKIECDCVKFDFNPDYSVNIAECMDYMYRPPQSWCYVEEIKEC